MDTNNLISHDPEVARQINNIYDMMTKLKDLEERYKKLDKVCKSDWLLEAILNDEVDDLKEFTRIVKDIVFAP